jgi:hypothetical protein
MRSRPAGSRTPTGQQRSANPHRSLFLWHGRLRRHFRDRRRKDGIVEWEAGGRAVEFDERDYDREVERFLCDRSWAPIERLAEFAADELLQGRTLNGLTFDWSSARIKAQAMTYSFSAAGEQRLVEFTWDGQTIESAIEATNQLLSEAYASESKHRLA